MKRQLVFLLLYFLSYTVLRFTDHISREQILILAVIGICGYLGLFNFLLRFIEQGVPHDRPKLLIKRDIFLGLLGSSSILALLYPMWEHRWMGENIDPATAIFIVLLPLLILMKLHTSEIVRFSLLSLMLIPVLLIHGYNEAAENAAIFTYLLWGLLIVTGVIQKTGQELGEQMEETAYDF